MKLVSLPTARPPRPAVRAWLAASLLLLPALAVRAEVVVTVEHHDSAAATKDFRFEGMRGPIDDNGSNDAKFTLVDGQQDANSAAPDTLYDGKAPDEEDQPDKNFFFAEGTDGGRLLLTLPAPEAVGRIETYSWHSDTRAPQVYKVYGSDGNAAGFVKEPKRPQDPTQGGWTLIGSVDTRQKFGSDGGQYGVGLKEKSGAALGTYRYLLFDVSRTEADDDDGNTFFSEINVDSADGAPAAPAAPAPADNAATASDAPVVVTVDHNDNDVATKDFKFKNVRGIIENGTEGAITVVDGQPDDGSAPPDALYDGKAPDEADQPDKNFFFRAGDEGGRFLLDVGEVESLEEVDTYSWHPNTRAPQVYKLYGSDGSGDDFEQTPKYPQDPAFHGWKLIARVDTREKFGLAGGQYGVSLKGKKGASLGTFRFLLFDVSRTEVEDTFGNTFFSEINVVPSAKSQSGDTP